MNKHAKQIIARILVALMIFSILPFDTLKTADVVMAKELESSVDADSTPSNGEGDSNNGTDIGNPESNAGTEDGGPGADAPGNADSSNGEGTSDADAPDGETPGNTDVPDGENSGNTDPSNGENSDNPDDPNTGDSDSEDPSDGTGGDGEEVEDPDASEEEGDGEEIELEEALLEESVEKAKAVRASNITVAESAFSAGGWNESIYAEIADGSVKNGDVLEVSYSGTTSGGASASGKLDEDGLTYLVREKGSGIRIDIPGIAAGTYTLTVKVGRSTLTKSGITVYAYDRSGFAHFNYTSGVGAYKDDGTLKANAEVIYVTKDNVNTVELTVGNVTVKGIGNILNSVGKECGEAGHAGECKRVSGKKTYYAKANGNKGIITKLSEAKKPLVVRFIGTVSDSGLWEPGTFAASTPSLIDGLTAFDSYDNGGSPDDNGHMARIQSGTNITLEGIGYDATIDGWGFHFMTESATVSKGYGKGFEVRNLKFINTPEDAIGMEGQQSGDAITASVERCWIHNNEFYCPHITGSPESDKSEGDGSVDFKRGMYFTCSYNYFENCHKTNLVGSSDSSLQYNLTYHHNYWYMCKARGPLTRQANVHMYNNIFDMQRDFAMNTRANAYIFSESNLFYACKSPQAVESGAIKSYNDSVSSVLWSKGSPGTVVTDKTQKVANSCKYQNTDYSSFDTNPALSYIPSNNYQLQEDFRELRQVIKSQTGIQARNPKRPEEITRSEYSVIDRNGSQINTFDSLPQKLAPGKMSKTSYAFEVGAAFTLEVEYSGTMNGVLINEEGEKLLDGNGYVTALPAGKYMIQALEFQPGDPANGTVAVFKDFTIASLNLYSAEGDNDVHFHRWTLDPSKSTDASCETAGKKVYTCTGTGECSQKTKEETIPALGHSWQWVTDTPATAEATGLKHQECIRCSARQNENTVIPVISQGGNTGDNSGGGNGVVPPAGDYVITFENGQVNGDADFFTVSGSSYISTNTLTTDDNNTYTGCLKMTSGGEVSFTCNEGAVLVMAVGNASRLSVDGNDVPISGKVVTVENLTAGKHTIKKSGDILHLYYVSVTNKASNEVYYTLSFEYNYDDSPEAIRVQVMAGASYSGMAALAPASLTRKGFELKGLYTDAYCTNAVTYPYAVNANATIYADWLEGDDEVEKEYSLIFNTNGGSNIASAHISTSQIYQLTEKPTRAGFAFAGWYDAAEGGNLVDAIKGSELRGNVTVYAHWNALEADTLLLNCNKASEDFADITANYTKDANITENKYVNGFIIHALSGGGGSNNESPKYYMTLKKEGGLYTNGVLLTDTNISGNADGLLKSIEFTTQGSGTLSVNMALSGSPSSGKTYEIVLAKKSASGALEEVRKSSITSGTTKTTKEFEIDAAGTYYLYAQGDKGVVYYSLKFTEPTYTIVYKPGAAGTGDFASVTAREGEAVNLPAYTPAAGYTFGGWSLDGVSAYTNASYTVNAADVKDNVITFTALYSKKQYTVKYEAGEGNLADGAEATVTASAGDRLQLPGCTSEEKIFRGWTIGNSEEIYKSYYLVDAADADEGDAITLTALYQDKPVTYNIVFDAAGGTLPAGMQQTVSAEADTTLSIGECTHPENKQFIGWKIGSGDTFKSSYTVNPSDADENKTITITAQYGEANKVYHTVILNLRGGELVDGGSLERTVEDNAEINLGECVKPGFTFMGWSVDGTPVAMPYTVTADVTLRAEYTEGEDKSDIVIVGLEPSYEYTGAKITPNIGVVDYDRDEEDRDGTLLVPGVDYTLKYTNNVKDSTGEKDLNKKPTVIVTGKGNYAGKSAKQAFDIVPAANPKVPQAQLADLKGAKIKKIDPVDYDGTPKHPEIKLTLKGKSEVIYKYIESADYTGYVEKKTSNAAAGEEAEGEDAAEPKYIPANVAISNNINKGTATILLTGRAAAGGKNSKPTTVKATFKINPVDLSIAGNKNNVDVKISDAPYAVKGAKPEVTVTYTFTSAGSDGEPETKEVKLVSGRDYIVKYSANKKAGKGKIAITGKGNYAKKYTNDAKTSYNITNLDMSEIEVSAVNAAKGLKAGKVKATVLDKDGNALKPSQYALELYKELDEEGNPVSGSLYKAADSLEAGKVYVLAKAKDEANLLKGSATKAAEFNVAAAEYNIAKAKVVLNKKVDGKPAMEYTGDPIEFDNNSDLKVTITIKEKGKPKKEETLVMGTDYEVAAYSNNISKGNATAILQGIGSYSGTKTVKFKIVGKKMEIAGKTTWDDIQDTLKNLVDGLFD